MSSVVTSRGSRRPKLKPLPKQYTDTNVIHESSIKNNDEIKTEENSITMSHTKSIDYIFAIKYLIANLSVINVYFEGLKTIQNIYDEWNIEILKVYVSNLNVLDEDIIIEQSYQYGGSKLRDFFKQQKANIKDMVINIKEKTKAFVNKIMKNTNKISPSVNTPKVNTPKVNIIKIIINNIILIRKYINILIKDNNGIIYDLLKNNFKKLDLINRCLNVIITEINNYIGIVSPNDVFALHDITISIEEKQIGGRKYNKLQNIKKKITKQGKSIDTHIAKYSKKKIVKKPTVHKKLNTASTTAKKIVRRVQ